MQAEKSEKVVPISRRVPPANTEAEDAILGSILLRPQTLEELLGAGLKAKHFYSAPCRDTFAACVSLYNAERPIDEITLSQQLKDAGQFDGIGGQNQIVKWFDLAVGGEPVGEYAEIVIERWRRRQFINVAQEMERAARDTSKPLTDAIAIAQQMIFDLSGAEERGKSLQMLEEVMTTCFNEIEERVENEAPLGVLSGFYDLDAITQGFQKSDLIILAARPSIGKTSLALNIARNAASQNLSTLIFSLEMDSEQLGYRLLSMESGLQSAQIRSGKMDEGSMERLVGKMSILSGLPIGLDDTANISTADMHSKAMQFKSRVGRLDLIIVDYLQLMEGGEDTKELTKLTRLLKLLARRLGVPIIALSQLNRDLESRANKRPMMADLRQSGSIEQDADLVIMLYRDEYYDPDTIDKGVAEVIISKHRNGSTGTIKLLFDKTSTQFRNLAR